MRVRMTLPWAIAALLTVGACHQNQPDTEAMPAGMGNDSTKSTMDTTRADSTRDSTRTPPRDSTRTPS